MNSKVFSQKVSLGDCRKLLVKVNENEESKEKEDVICHLMGLHSPYLPEIYGMEQRGDFKIVAEEWVYGISLAGILRGKGLPMGWKQEFNIKEITEIGIQLCKAICELQELHPPIFHGDIKPENILLTHRYPIRIKLIDCDDGFLWHPNMRYKKMKGTTGFAAPEQFMGEPVDFTTDLYAIARTLEFLLYAYPAYRAKKLHKAIKKATASNPRDRFVTIKEFQSILYSCL